ncbi:tripartite tricarboxylate transporter TctB family protein [Marinicrinis sediminis]|uniref:Tripartite tricarboxylate transporter TctB family protein n=1 Tax=Marinicrinis sediminis TaxID=1652465 RepID=A0ABW5R847_9BACL
MHKKIEAKQIYTVLHYVFPALVGIILWIMIPYHVETGRSLLNEPQNTKLFPSLLACIMIGITIIRIVMFLITKKVEETGTNPALKMNRNLIAGILLLLFYVVSMQGLGYLITTCIVINVAAYLLGSAKGYKVILFSILVTFAIWYPFAVVLNVNLPALPWFL